MVQSVLLSREVFETEEAARAWIMEHGYQAEKPPDVTERFFRFRQVDPETMDPDSMRTISLTRGVEAIVGFLKEAYDD